MEVARFEEVQAEFMARVSQAVYGTLATIDRKNRPRSRVVHPIWDGSTGWVISWPASHKAKHLAYNPSVSLAYIPDKAKPVYVDAIAEWIDTVEEKRRIWDLHAATPPPLGFDPQPHYGTIDHPYYGLLRLTPWRIELGNLYGEPLIWRRQRVAAGLRAEERISMQAKTVDLCDQYSAELHVAAPIFRDYGGKIAFCGPISTVQVFEDNVLVRAALEEPGAGRVLVIDGGGSLRCALLGDQLAALGLGNGWAGVVINGCIRDVATLAGLPFGVKALAATPLRSANTNPRSRV
jgi:regulator of ribonuclease activity A